ncbi:thioredoxin [Candidatus Gracilibacteria bacterium]|nr:thioredoxin [Candidatus Gracilibacteria bacterium]
MATQFTDQNFAAQTGKGLAIVDMYADWCGPCKMMAPAFEELAKNYEGKVTMGKLNVDENGETPMKFGVSGIPTLVFLKDGVEIGRTVGFQSKDALDGKIKEIFAF